MRLPERGKGPTWLNGLSLSKGAVSHKYVDGKAITAGPMALQDVLFVERAALVEHLMLELKRLEPDRWACSGCVQLSMEFKLVGLTQGC